MVWAQSYTRWGPLDLNLDEVANLRIVVFQPEVADGHVVRSVAVGPDPVEGELPVGQPYWESAFEQHVLALQDVQGLAGRLPGLCHACKKNSVRLKTTVNTLIVVPGIAKLKVKRFWFDPLSQVNENQI